MEAVRISTGVDEEKGDGAVGFLFGGDGGQADDDMGLLGNLPQQGGRIVDVG